MMMHINGSERKDISLQLCMTETEEMFDSVRETKEEMEGIKEMTEGERGGSGRHEKCVRHPGFITYDLAG